MRPAWCPPRYPEDGHVTPAVEACELLVPTAPRVTPVRTADQVVLALAPARATLACEGNVTEIPLFALNNKVGLESAGESLTGLTKLAV